MVMGSLTIGGIGLVSPLGNAVHGPAAARAGIHRSHLLDGVDVLDPVDVAMVPLRGHCVPDLTFGFEGRARLQQLATATLEDLRLHSPSLATCQRLGLILLVSAGHTEREVARQLEQAGQPDARADADAAERDRQLSLADLVERILRSVPWLKTAQTSMLFMEHTGMVDALQLADSWLRPDGCDACIVLAVDSLTDPVRLPGQVLAALVRTPGNTHAYVPGEIGAAVVVMRREHVQVPLAHIQSAVSDREQQPNQARVYAQVVAQALTAAGPGSVGSAICDHTGEMWRFAAYAQMLTQLAKPARTLADAKVIMVGEHFGEVGAATGVTACVLACRAFARGYAKGDLIPICLSDADGARACLVVQGTAAPL